MVRFWNRVEKIERPKGKTFRCKWQRKRNPFDCIQSLSEKQKETSNTNTHVTGREKPSERQMKQIKKRQPFTQEKRRRRRRHRWDAGKFLGELRWEVHLNSSSNLSLPTFNVVEKKGQKSFAKARKQRDTENSFLGIELARDCLVSCPTFFFKKVTNFIRLHEKLLN